jgi:hypothetical protein
LVRQTLVLKYQNLEQYGDRSWSSLNFINQFLFSETLSCFPSSLSGEKSIQRKTEDEQEQLSQIILLCDFKLPKVLWKRRTFGMGPLSIYA